MQRTLKNYIVLFFKGMAMGAADVVPGVSGGTIAFISGIYQELINSISNINLELNSKYFVYRKTNKKMELVGGFIINSECSGGFCNY